MPRLYKTTKGKRVRLTTFYTLKMKPRIMKKSCSETKYKRIASFYANTTLRVEWGLPNYFFSCKGFWYDNIARLFLHVFVE